MSVVKLGHNFYIVKRSSVSCGACCTVMLRYQAFTLFV